MIIQCLITSLIDAFGIFQHTDNSQLHNPRQFVRVLFLTRDIYNQINKSNANHDVIYLLLKRRCSGLFSQNQTGFKYDCSAKSQIYKSFILYIYFIVIFNRNKNFIYKKHRATYQEESTSRKEDHIQIVERFNQKC